MIDLHTHSSASDGDLEPAQLVEKAACLGLSALALTDHDTISGLSEAKKAAQALGIRLISGVELEIQTGNPEGAGILPVINGEFHLLGLGIDKPSPALTAALERLAGARDRRNREMVERIRAAGIDAEYGAVKAFAGGGIVGRPHFGAFLISRRVVKSQEQAFKRWLGKGRPFYVPKEGLEFEKAAGLIHDSGGIAVLAHPMSLYVAWGRLPGLFAVLRERGLDGMEAWHPTAKPKACKRLEELGRGLGLCITAGSDFHGSARPDRKLGYTAGDRQIEDRFLEGIPPG
ncbi:MAG: PHP domain-containing protein [Treponema sp.]|jgi:predicted metal-dependent phosphoesterase TrpH|nr:PHP domain-containing protein [Treponema sp.]